MYKIEKGVAEGYTIEISKPFRKGSDKYSLAIRQAASRLEKANETVWLAEEQATQELHAAVADMELIQISVGTAYADWHDNAGGNKKYSSITRGYFTIPVKVGFTAAAQAAVAIHDEIMELAGELVPAFAEESEYDSYLADRAKNGRVVISDNPASILAIIKGIDAIRQDPDADWFHLWELGLELDQDSTKLESKTDINPIVRQVMAGI